MKPVFFLFANRPFFFSLLAFFHSALYNTFKFLTPLSQSPRPKMQTEILIVKNPLFYQNLVPEAFQVLIADGSWIPLVFSAVESVVQRHFFQLCELDWDYSREEPEKLAAAYSTYKSIFYKGLDSQQELFAQQVADEIEEEIKANAAQALAAKESQDEE